jgi:hypothetical protein
MSAKEGILILFSMLMFAFALREGVHHCKQVFVRFQESFKDVDCPRRMILISLAFVTSTAVSIGPACYYGMHLLSDMTTVWYA